MQPKEIPNGEALRHELVWLSKLAHERELAAALSLLDKEFEHWRNHTLNAFELNDKIHRFYKDIARDLWGKYVLNNFHDLLVTQAIVQGIIKKDELTPALLVFLEPKIKRYRQSLATNKEQTK